MDGPHGFAFRIFQSQGKTTWGNISQLTWTMHYYTYESVFELQTLYLSILKSEF